MVCHGNLATRAEEVKTEIAVIFLYLRISTWLSPHSRPPPNPKHRFGVLQVVVHWIKSFIYFNDLVFDKFYLERTWGITYWVQNFRASVDTSLIKSVSLLCTTQVLPTGLIISHEAEIHRHIHTHTHTHTHIHTHYGQFLYIKVRCSRDITSSMTGLFWF